MRSTKILSALLLVLTISSAASAYLVPGQPGNNQGGGQPPQYQPPHGGGDHGGGDHGDHGHGGGGGYGPGHGPGHGPGGGHGGGGGYYPPQPPYYPPAPQPYYPPQPPPQPYYPPAPQIIAQQVYVGRAVADERISLSDLAGLNSQFAGWTIVAVTARTRPNSPAMTTIRLAVNETVIATQINPGYQINLYPTTRVTTGYSNIELWINGSTYIDTIEVQLQR